MAKCSPDWLYIVTLDLNQREYLRDDMSFMFAETVKLNMIEEK